MVVVGLKPGETGAILIKDSGVGVSVSTSGARLGIWRDVSAIIANNSRCQVVIWTDRAREVENILATLRLNGTSLKNICVLNEGDK